MASLVKENLARVLARIEGAAHSVSRSPDSVTLVAATKTQSIETVSEYVAACEALGVRPVCGENYAQELELKAGALPGVEWHFIGRLQRNKVGIVTKYCKLIHSIDSERLMDTVKVSTARDGAACEFLLQVNVSRDPNKGGFLFEHFTPEFIERLRLHPHRLRGLMTILELGIHEAQQREQYAALANLSAVLESAAAFAPVSTTEARRVKGPELSMGMSEDFDVAVACGATIVRVGSAIFGPRRS